MIYEHFQYNLVVNAHPTAFDNIKSFNRNQHYNQV